jgi:alkylhydroperoxidase family enzyme
VLLPKLDGTAERTPHEAAALDFAERLAADHTSVGAPVIARLRALFTDAEIVELGLVTGAFIMLGRLHRAFGIAPMTAATHALLDGGGT